MKKLSLFAASVSTALVCAAVPASFNWSTAEFSLDTAEARVGRPLTATSVAGVSRRVHRREYRRAAAVGAAAVGGAAAGAAYVGAPASTYAPGPAAYVGGPAPASLRARAATGRAISLRRGNPTDDGCAKECHDQHSAVFFAAH
jgi:hypothetical protein